MLIRFQRSACLLALVALLGGPLAETVCAVICAPNQQAPRQQASHQQTSHQQHVAQPTTAEASASHHDASGPAHHQDAAATHACCRDSAPGITNLSAPGCDTHGKSNNEPQALLTVGRSITQKAVSASPALAHERAALISITARHATFGHSPGRHPSGGSRVPLVLRI